MYESLRLGELKCTRKFLQLADRSTGTLKNAVEDVLIKVGELIFPMDFIVLEIESISNRKAQIPVILD